MKKFILPILFLILAVDVAVCIYAFKHRWDPLEGSLTSEILERFSDSKLAFVEETIHVGIRWIDADGYSIILQPTESVSVAVSAIDMPEIPVADAYFGKHLKIIRKVFAARGYIQNEQNSSTSTVDERFYDYIEGYEKGDSLCTVSVNPDLVGFGVAPFDMGYHLQVACGKGLADAQAEQRPILEALGYQNTDISIHIHQREGAFIEIGEGSRRAGQTVVLKKEGEGYRVLLKSQEAPACEILDKEQIPPSVLSSIGQGGCYESNGEYREARVGTSSPQQIN